MFSYILIACLALVCAAAGPTSFIKKCNSEDDKCLKESTKEAIPVFAAGFPDLGIDTLDPLTFKTLDASSPSLKLVLRDVTLKGLQGCRPKKIQRDSAKSKLYVRLSCDVVGDGNYEMKGQLFIVPIEGKDKVHLNLKKIQLSADLDMDVIDGADGQKHWNIKDWKYSFELKDRADLVFNNLFPNNELLGRAARELVKTSSNEIIMELGPPIIKTLATKIVTSVNEYFHKVPYDQLSLD